MKDSELHAIERLLYSSENDDVEKELRNCDCYKFLFVYMYNYNWDNGFEIPVVVMNNQNCDLSTALLMFYRAEGAVYLEGRNLDTSLSKWKDFLDKLYLKIICKEYSVSDIRFRVPLSKTQLFKFKKELSDIEEILIKEIGTIDLEISL